MLWYVNKQIVKLSLQAPTPRSKFGNVIGNIQNKLGNPASKTALKFTVKLSIMSCYRFFYFNLKDYCHTVVLRGLNLLLAAISVYNECFLLLQEFFIQNEAMSPAFQTFLHLMYDQDVFDENVILDWFKSPSQDDTLGNENQEKIREQVSPC